MKMQLDKTDYAVGLAAAASLIGLAIYIFTSVSGYLASSPVNWLPVAGTGIAVILMAVLIFMKEKFSLLAADSMMIGSAALLLYSIYEFVLGRVSLAADVYFIPVNYPPSEAAALHISIAGLVLYFAADLAMITAAFMKRSEEK